MAHVVILGAGIGGVAAAIEVRDELAKAHQVTVVSDIPNFQFTPSNPWLAVNWRKPEELKVPLAPVFRKKNIGFTDVGAKTVHPKENRVELNNGESLSYDYLVIATGPKLAFGEIRALARTAATPIRSARSSTPKSPRRRGKNSARTPARS